VGLGSSTRRVDGQRLGSISVDVLIPAHNEDRQIASTLTQISLALDRAKEKAPALRSQIRVGADGCTDQTVRRVNDFDRNIGLIESRVSRGKWKTLRELVKQSQAEWVILADAGILWPEDLLLQMLDWMQDPSVLGIAPTYRASAPGVRGSQLEGVHWKLERFLKSQEAYLGGPVSVHGATVAYRRQALNSVFDSLLDLNWLNDDVVIPLQMRYLNPGKKIVYLSDVAVHDSGTDFTGPEVLPLSAIMKRGTRLVHGNSQWIRILLPQILRHRSEVAWVASRRIARIFWAYWILLIALGIGCLEPWIVLAYLLFPGVLAILRPKTFRKLVAAWMVSLNSPWQILTRSPLRDVAW